MRNNETKQGPVRVVVIEDSAVQRYALVAVASRDERLAVVGAYASAEAALDAIERDQPDVISMDLHLPGMHGLEATLRVMERRPTPIVIVSDDAARDRTLPLRALQAGALAVCRKPGSPTDPADRELAREYCDHLVTMSRISLVRRRRHLSARSGQIASERPERPWPIRSIGLVASTGGPPALQRVLRDLGPDCPVPVFVVQHMAPSFLDGFVQWLDDVTPMKVERAVEGLAPEPRRAYVAACERHLTLGPSGIHLEDGPPVAGHVPSGTVLLGSMARAYGKGAAGVVLTGMGADGAEGLLEIRRAGGLAVAESQDTACVFGMPRAAIEMEAADHVLPLDRIGPFLRRAVQTSSPASPGASRV